MRKEKGLINDFEIRDGVFWCTIEFGMKPQELQEIKWKEDRTGLENKAVDYQWEDREEGRLCIATDFLKKDFAIRTWRLILVLANGKEIPVYYGKERDESNFGKMLSLSKTEVITERHIHLIPAMDKDGAFAIRKWRTKSEAIKTKPAYAEKIRRFGTTIEVELEKRYTKVVKEAEIFIWSRSCRRLERIPVSVKGVNEGRFSFDIRKYIEKNGDTLQRLWEVFLVMNMEGSYYLSRIEEKGNREWEKKKGEAAKNGVEFVMPDKPKVMDESERFFGGIPYIYKDAGAYEIETMNPNQTEWLLMPYYTEEMQLACKFIHRRNFYVTQFRERMLDVKIKKGVCFITTLSNHEDFLYHDLIIRYRNQDSTSTENGREVHEEPAASTQKEEELSFELISKKRTRKGVRQVWSLSFHKIRFQQYIWDLFLIGEKEGYDYEVRPINPDGKRFRKKLYKGYANDYTDGNGQIVFPYLTENENVVIFCRQRQEYDDMRYVIKERIALFWYRCFKWYYDKKNILLLYEKHCKMAQDNSYAMFLYLTGENAKKEIREATYYIMDKSQPDYMKLEGYGKKVLNFMGVKHLIYLQAAKLFVSIDSKRHAYAWRSRNSKIVDAIREKPFLFLQHGVIGLKRVDYIYKKGGINSANHIVLSSEMEKGIAMKWFGYDEKEVIVAGMARWDEMEDASRRNRNILLMPTWRNWLQEITEDVFIESDYFKHYSELLGSKELEDYLETYDLQLIFCMHPKFRDFMDQYRVSSNRIQLFSYDTKPIIDLITECRLLITDYSSVSWDFYYLKKPIIFYQFDYNKYMEWQGSYYDMEKELFGPRVFDREGLLTELKKYCGNDFMEEEKYSGMRETCLPKEMGRIRKHIYQEIERLYFRIGH